MMSRLNVRKVPAPSERALPIFEEFDRLADRIRVEAYNLFTGRGAVEGHALDDWLTAERELCGPAIEVAERKGEFVLSLPLEGFELDDIDVTATPREILIKGEKKTTRTSGDDETQLRWSEYRSKGVLRRAELPAPIDVEKITAKLQRGVLKIVAPKTAAEADTPTKRIDVATRAETRSRPSESPPHV
jgi:HSP20 family protein